MDCRDRLRAGELGEPHKITREDGSYVRLYYDDALRLQREKYYDAAGFPVETIIYQYDDAGNRTAYSDDTGTYNYSANADSDYLLGSIDGPGSDDSTFGYDAGGRLTSLARGGDSWTLTYNAAGQVTGVQDVGGADVDHSYTYDALGRRTGASDGTSQRNFLVAPAAQRLGPGVLDVAVQHLAADDSSGDLLTGWVYAGENPILRFEPDGMGGYEMNYYLEDASDSIAALVDGNAAKVAEYRYDGFGNNLNAALYDDPTSNSGGDFGFHVSAHHNHSARLRFVV